MASLKGSSVEVDNIPAELVQADGETMFGVLTEICNHGDHPSNGLAVE